MILAGDLRVGDHFTREFRVAKRAQSYIIVEGVHDGYDHTIDNSSRVTPVERPIQVGDQVRLKTYPNGTPYRVLWVGPEAPASRKGDWEQQVVIQFDTDIPNIRDMSELIRV